METDGTDDTSETQEAAHTGDTGNSGDIDDVSDPGNTDETSGSDDSGGTEYRGKIGETDAKPDPSCSTESRDSSGVTGGAASRDGNGHAAPPAHHALLAKLRLGLAQLRYLPRSLALTWQAARLWTLAWLGLLFLGGVLPIASVYLTRAIVDAVVAALKPGGGEAAERVATTWDLFLPVLGLLALLAAVLVLAEGLRCVTGWVRTAQAERVRDHIQGRIHEQAAAADLAFFERPDFYDSLHRATWESSDRSVALLETLGSLMQSSVTLLAMMAVIVPYGWWLPAALLASTLPAFAIVIRYAVRQHLWWKSVTRDERRARYYDWMLTGHDSAAEIRLFDLGAHFRSAYQALRRILREGRVDLERRHAALDFVASLLALLLAGAAVAVMLWRAVRGAITLGDLALFFQAFRQGQSMMRSLIENVGNLYRNSLFLGNLFEYLAIAPTIVAPAAPPGPRPVPEALREGIRFEDVGFSYPGAGLHEGPRATDRDEGRDGGHRRPVLDGFRLEIPAGKMVAIVGPNGAGKSTLVKLISRLYDPDRGRVTLDGVDLRDFDPSELRRRITVLFQEPVRYHGTVRENIALGDLRVKHSEADIAEAARIAGATEEIAGLPRGYETELGRIFGEGSELSVGEWQRIALARAFLRRSPIVILDEPTSAMDPWAEAEWLDRLGELGKGRTVLIVTHRLTTAMRADLIHVVVEGRVEESGSHRELIERGGLYCRAWKAREHADRGREKAS